MSFLTSRAPILTRRFNPAQLAPVARLSTTPRSYKGPVDAAKDAAKTVDRAVSDVAVKGIDKGQEAAAKVREVAGVKAGEAQGKAEELKGQAQGKAAELKGEAKGKAAEVKAKM